jgi:hypothetical protein
MKRNGRLYVPGVEFDEQRAIPSASLGCFAGLDLHVYLNVTTPMILKIATTSTWLDAIDVK